MNHELQVRTRQGSRGPFGPVEARYPVYAIRAAIKGLASEDAPNPFPLLDGITPHEDTLFNRWQMNRLLLEIENLTSIIEGSGMPSESLNPLLLSMAELAIVITKTERINHGFICIIGI